MAPEPSPIMDMSTPGGGSDDITMGEGPIMLGTIVTGIDIVVIGIGIDIVVGLVNVAAAMVDWNPGEPEDIGLWAPSFIIDIPF